MEKQIIYTPPPDKSITIRALVLASLSPKKTEIINPLISDDTLNTIKTLRKLGAKISINKNKITVIGFDKKNARKTKINVGESALLLNLLLPILLNQKHIYIINGKKTILTRNFKQTIKAFKELGAKIEHKNFKLPVITYPSRLKSKTLKVMSAQTKSALLLASLYGTKIKIKDPLKTRDHTEKMLELYGAKLKRKNNMIWISKAIFKPRNTKIPGDISQAAVFITLAILLKRKITIKNCGINPLRTGFLNSISKMGVKVKFKNKKIISNEKVADIVITPEEKLKPIRLKNITSLIDEIMLLCLLSSTARGKSIIKNIQALKNKESNRAKTIHEILKKLGVKTLLKKNEIIIEGPTDFKPVNEIDTQQDHRVAMVGGILKKIINKRLKIKNPECVKKTYPNFWKDINSFFDY